MGGQTEGHSSRRMCLPGEVDLGGRRSHGGAEWGKAWWCCASRHRKVRHPPRGCVRDLVAAGGSGLPQRWFVALFTSPVKVGRPITRRKGMPHEHGRAQPPAPLTVPKPDSKQAQGDLQQAGSKLLASGSRGRGCRSPVSRGTAAGRGNGLRTSSPCGSTRSPRWLVCGDPHPYRRTCGGWRCRPLQSTERAGTATGRP